MTSWSRRAGCSGCCGPCTPIRRFGLVGPCSNFVSGPQQVVTRYDSLADLDGFAWDWGGSHEGVRVDVNRLVGFCLLIRRAVVEAIGLLDEQFGVGCFEDDDYCLRRSRPATGL